MTTTPTIIRCTVCKTTATFVARFAHNNEIDGAAAAAALAARNGKPSFAGRYTDLASLLCCGRTPKMITVRGSFRPEHKCDARCLSSVGGKCECACGGKNHGMAYAA